MYGMVMSAIRINQGKLEAENSQLRAQCEELSLQNGRLRDVVGKLGNRKLVLTVAGSLNSGQLAVDPMLVDPEWKRDKTPLEQVRKISFF
jgi:hypothetical protein